MKRAVMFLAIALCVMAMPALAGQQAAGTAPASVVSPAPASSPSTAQPGPRLQPEWRSYEPSVTDSSTSGRASLSEGRHTIVVSTLALILIVVIVVLLVSN